jgi:hypothetical protein
VRLVEAVVGAIADFGYEPFAESTDSDVRFLARTASGNDYRAQFILSEEKIVRLVIHLDTMYRRERMSWVAEFVQRLDAQIAVLGGFGFDHASGGIYFRYGLDLRDREISKEVFILALNSVAFAIRVFETAKPFIENAGKAKPSSIVSTALILAGGTDGDIFVPLEAKRLIIKLVR